ncbi:PREDICTED: probable terpene synthase 2 isoform X2 [Lupinus angustifolius]|uniref:probable terpene synthase 2 isoform X2 n=1 Tax=Lupinus angustifolius TaxID=3871 RepID=UPI00092EEB63|nr:PREDICTED: probable terpene synthase 2 isoform X2 [Lupinus angustifolius]
MSFASSTLTCFSLVDKSDDLRSQIAHFHPTIWKDYFLQYASDSKELDLTSPEIETLKEEVRNVFNKFRDVHGKFDERINTDVEGMLSLYEASYLRIHGENILDEALAFTSTHLESISSQLRPFLEEQIKYSLRQPLHMGLPRLEARRYISIYQQDPSHHECLLALAKLDFNILQKLHQKEVGNISKWWKELDIPRNLPFIRDRIVELCFWILGVYFEPQYSQARKIMMKVIFLVAIVDDTYDAFGTIDELELFTKAIERWDISCLNDLPEYMKLTYGLLMNVYEETKQLVMKEGRAYSIDYGIKEFKKIAQAYMTEARWLNCKYIPTTEEYTNISLVSCGYPLLATTSYIGMGDIATEEIFKWVTKEPKIIKASSVVGRLMDDIVSNEFEQKREHVASFLECYMRQYGMSREDAINECRRRVTNAWKDINEECLRQTKVPKPFVMRILNLTRSIDVIYKDQDNFTHAGGVMKTYIQALLVDPVPI